MTVNPISFKGVYKVSLPKVPEAQNEQEKAAFTDTAVNVVVMGANSSVDRPKVDANKKFMYFKIDDKYDAQFEAGFKTILNNCNQKFNVDMAKKAYIQKVSDDEYQKAQNLE